MAWNENPKREDSEMDGETDELPIVVPNETLNDDEPLRSLIFKDMVSRELKLRLDESRYRLWKRRVKLWCEANNHPMSNFYILKLSGPNSAVKEGYCHCGERYGAIPVDNEDIPLPRLWDKMREISSLAVTDQPASPEDEEGQTRQREEFGV